MISDSLAELIFKCGETNLWRILTEKDLFAVRLRNGEMVHCIMMGNAGFHYSVGIYLGASGFRTLANLNKFDLSKLDNDDPSISDISHLMDCINCDVVPYGGLNDESIKHQLEEYARKKNLRVDSDRMLVEFMRFRPYIFPNFELDERDLLVVEDVLTAVISIQDWIHTGKESLKTFRVNIDVVRDTGKRIPCIVVGEDGSTHLESSIVPMLESIEYPKPLLEKGFIASLQALPVLGEYQCRYVTMDTAVREDNCIYYPMTMLYADSITSEVGILKLFKYSEENLNESLREFAATLIALGRRPRAIYIQDERTKAFLKGFCYQVGIQLCMVRNLRNVEEFWRGLANHIKR